MKEIIDSNLEEDGGFDKGVVYICSRRRRGRVRGVNGKLVVIFCRIYFNYSIASANVHLIAFFIFLCVCFDEISLHKWANGEGWLSLC